MVRVRSNAMSIFVALLLVLFMSPVKNAFAHPASPAVAKAFSVQQESPDQGEAQDIQDDMDEGPDMDIDANEGPEVEEMDANNDVQETDEDRAEDELEDAQEAQEDVPPAA